jgi:hypothetical protein
MRVVRLVDEADWKSLWPIVENIFFAIVAVLTLAEEKLLTPAERMCGAARALA